MLKPTWERDGIALYCGDCLQSLPQLEAVGLIVTSPPYNCRMPYGAFVDEMPWADYYAFVGRLLDTCYGVLEMGGTLAIVVPGVIRWQADHKYAGTWAGFDAGYRTHRNGIKVLGRARIEPLGFKVFGMMAERDPHVREPIVWVKGVNGPVASEWRMGCDSDPYMRPSHEMILLGSKGQWFHRGGTGRRGPEAVPFLEETKDVWMIPARSVKGHPASFPSEIPERLARLFLHSEDSTVCDPMMGSGQTALAAIRCGRRFIGCDISPQYFDLSVSRIEKALAEKAAELPLGATA